MYYSEKYKSQWWLPPRTASRMVKKILHRLEFIEKDGHHGFSIKNRYWDLNVLIRNPYSRAVSYWLLNNERNYNSNRFTTFSESVYKLNDYLRDLHVGDFKNPSTTLISEKIQNYNLIRYESLFDDLMKISYIKENQLELREELSILDLGNAPWRKDRPKELVKPYFEFYTQELADIVYTKKQSEFELGGYQRDSWKTLVK
jgi:hypothetical protein